MSRPVWVTGVGLLSSIGQGTEAHGPLLAERAAAARRLALCAGCAVQPAAVPDLGRYVPNRLEQKRLGRVQQLAIVAAGDALADAGLLGQPGSLDDAMVLIGARGGERDIGFDAGAFAMPELRDDHVALNRHLSAGTRPTLFLSQLPNLLAGHLSILFKIAGGSRTVLGEDLAGAQAMRAAHRLIATGRAQIVLAGSAFVADREDLLLLQAAAGRLWNGTDEPPPIGLRDRANGGIVPGSLAAFVVLEAADHARARGATPFCAISALDVAPAVAEPGAFTAGLPSQLAERGTGMAILSGATGAMPATALDVEAWHTLRHEMPFALRFPASLLGHAAEAAFPAHLALAAIALRDGRLWAAGPGEADAPPSHAPLSRVLVTGAGAEAGLSHAMLQAVPTAEPL